MAWLALGTVPAWSESVILRLRAINPSESQAQKVEVKSYLPKPTTPADVVDVGDFELTYDMHKGQYMVRREVELAPKEVRSFQVELRDIWLIPEASLAELEAHAGRLTDMLKGSAQAATAGELRDTIGKNTAALRERQNAYLITRAKAIDHIRAFESNLELLERARKDIGMLENFVIGIDKDPGKLEGVARSATGRPAAEVTPGATQGEAVIRIRISNPSVEKHSLPIKQDLPQEIQPADVLDADNLEVHFDSARRMCYVFGENVELEPKEEKLFEIRVRNRWAVAKERLDGLEGRATNLLALAAAAKTYTSVKALAQTIVQEIADIRRQKSPETVDQDYVARYRVQDQKLKDLEAKIVRLEELFQPRAPIQKLPEAPILRIQPPSTKTTWIIIYIILGFLGILSLLFFLRWYGRSKAENVPLSETESAGKEKALGPEEKAASNEENKR
jgi:hypothetical protein